MAEAAAAFVGSLPALDPHALARTIAHRITLLYRSVEHGYVIALAAARQHELGSPCIPATVVGIPKLPGVLEDFEFERAHLVGGAEEGYVGWPVDVVYYAGRFWLHMKYMGITLSGRDSDDSLIAFRVPRPGTWAAGGDRPWTPQDAEYVVRSTYLMFRNLFAAGLPVEHALKQLKGFVDARVSTFALAQASSNLLSIRMGTFVASEEHVQVAMQHGSFEELDGESVADAARLNRVLRKHEQVDDTCFNDDHHGVPIRQVVAPFQHEMEGRAACCYSYEVPALDVICA